jgi:uncharacterized protein YqjF (DUF2071 family)
MRTTTLETPDGIDRIGPTRRPDDVVVMYQRWACLLFLHWEVPVSTLRPIVPDALEVDTFEGRAFVGLVPFTMTGVRPRGLPAVRWLSDFHEVNVRTYVHFQGRDPGVYFISLDAAQPIAARVGRWTYRLPYRVARMALNGKNARGGEEDVADDGWMTYASERTALGPMPATCSVRYRQTGTPAASAPGTLEHFLAERYLLYTASGDHLDRGAVHHTPYPLQTAEVAHLEESLIAAAGVPREGPPALAHYARAVEVDVYPLRRVRR